MSTKWKKLIFLIASAGDQSKRDFNNTPPVVVSTRWNPTPEQLRALEELYRRGTRTPSAEQIQHITAQLRRFGKIEGKNVFYWFQNHKARERQKRRRQVESGHPGYDLDFALEKKDLGKKKPHTIISLWLIFKLIQKKTKKKRKKEIKKREVSDDAFSYYAWLPQWHFFPFVF